MIGTVLTQPKREMCGVPLSVAQRKPQRSQVPLVQEERMKDEGSHVGTEPHEWSSHGRVGWRPPLPLIGRTSSGYRRG